MHAYGYRSLRTAALALLVLGTSHGARADEHLVSDLDPARLYDVRADGVVIHGNLQPGARGFVTFTAPPGATIEVVAAGAGDVTPPAAIDDLAATPGAPGALALAWTAPGDDGASGQADAYEIRWSTSPSGLGSSPVVVIGAPDPAPAGTAESHVIAGLPEGSTVHVAIVSRDEVGNWSASSNVASATVAGGSGSGGGDSDTSPPAPVGDLAVIRVSSHTATLAWTASGDDGTTGRAAHYDLRYALEPIDELSFADAVPVALPLPAEAGETEEHTIQDLDSGTRHYFVLRVEDDAGNVSTLSDNVLVRTRGLDNAPIPPGTPNGWIVEGHVTLAWEPSPDPLVIGYHVYRTPDGALEETRLTPQPTADASFTDASAEEGVAYTYRVTADDGAMESSESATVWIRATERVPQAPVVEKMYPNPARAGDAVRFRIGIPEVGPGHPEGQRVTIDLYDVAGRRVGRVFDDFVQPGVREVSWDPSASGRAFAPGVYVTLVTAGRASARDRLAIAR